MIKIWHDTAWDDYIGWQSEDKKTVRKINALVKDIERNGLNCVGKPEKLKYLPGYSVKIDGGNRLVFDIIDNKLEIYACKGHYGDK